MTLVIIVSERHLDNEGVAKISLDDFVAATVMDAQKFRNLHNLIEY